METLILATILIPFPQPLTVEHFDSEVTYELHRAEVEAEREKVQKKLLPHVAAGAKVIHVEGIYTTHSVQFWLNVLEARDNGLELTRGQRMGIAGWGRLVAIGELELKPWADGKTEPGAIVLGNYR
jgi:hypothetical protein